MFQKNRFQDCRWSRPQCVGAGALPFMAYFTISLNHISLSVKWINDTLYDTYEAWVLELQILYSCSSLRLLHKMAGYEPYQPPYYGYYGVSLKLLSRSHGFSTLQIVNQNAGYAVFSAIHAWRREVFRIVCMRCMRMCRIQSQGHDTDSVMCSCLPNGFFCATRGNYICCL